MHIAFLTSEYPHSFLNSSAGIGSSIKNLAKELIKLSCEVSVFVYGQKDKLEFSDDGVKVISIRSIDYKFGGFYFYRKHIEKVIKYYNLKNMIDILEAPDWTGITAFMKFQFPLLIRLHGSDTYFCHLEKRKQKWKNYYFENRALKSADHIISVSKFTADITKKLFKIDKNIEVINNGIDIHLFSPKEDVSETNSILYFGSIIRKKGVLELAKVFNLLHKEEPNINLIFVGRDVIDWATGKSTVQMIRDILTPSVIEKVRYISNINYNKIPELIAESNVVVLPSFAEAFPMSWLEAMSMGKILVGSNIGWSKEIINNGVDGYTVNPKNHEKFCEVLLNIFEDTKEMKCISKSARVKVVQNFDSAIISKQNYNFYLSIL